MNLTDCLPFLLYKFKHESDLKEAVLEVSEKFTKDRERIGDYLKDPRLVSAYTAFYFTTNYPKLSEVLKWFPEEWKALVKGRPLVDLGAGPGTFGLAWKELMDGEIFQIENSPVMREQARKLWEGFHPGVPLKQSSSGIAVPGSVLLFGHSANEMGADLALKYIKQVDPEHILFIEPGTKSFFPEMLKIRRQLLNESYNVIFPCPSANECPMSLSDKDWCHQFIKVKQDPEVERLSQMIHRDRKLLPLIVHLYSKSYLHHDRERIVRVHPDTKFSYEWDVCLGNHIERYQVMKRGMDKKQQKEIGEVLSGASITTKLDKDMGETKRVNLISAKS